MWSLTIWATVTSHNLFLSTHPRCVYAVAYCVANICLCVGSCPCFINAGDMIYLSCLFCPSRAHSLPWFNPNRSDANIVCTCGRLASRLRYSWQLCCNPCMLIAVFVCIFAFFTCRSITMTAVFVTRTVTSQTGRTSRKLSIASLQVIDRDYRGVPKFWTH